VTVGPAQRARRVFINCPFDQPFEPLFLAYVAGLVGLGLTPVTVLDLPSDGRSRLERLLDVVASCHSSIHDLSRVESSGGRSPVPRFNMPFELGIAVGQRATKRAGYRFFLFERKAFRLQKSSSDINGVDPHVHGGTARGILRELLGAFPREGPIAQPTTDDLQRVHRALVKAAEILKRENRASSVFTSTLSRGVVLAARQIVERLGLFRAKGVRAPRPRIDRRRRGR
jgi:hypothetical protein